MSVGPEDESSRERWPKSRAARRIGRSGRTLERWEAEGILPKSHLFGPPGKERRCWWKDEILSWEREQTERLAKRPFPGGGT